MGRPWPSAVSDSRDAACIAFLPSSPGGPLYDGNGSVAPDFFPGCATVSREAKFDLLIQTFLFMDLTFHAD